MSLISRGNSGRRVLSPMELAFTREYRSHCYQKKSPRQLYHIAMAQFQSVLAIVARIAALAETYQSLLSERQGFTHARLAKLHRTLGSLLVEADTDPDGDAMLKYDRALPYLALAGSLVGKEFDILVDRSYLVSACAIRNTPCL